MNAPVTRPNAVVWHIHRALPTWTHPILRAVTYTAWALLFPVSVFLGVILVLNWGTAPGLFVAGGLFVIWAGVGAWWAVERWEL